MRRRLSCWLCSLRLQGPHAVHRHWPVQRGHLWVTQDIICGSAVCKNGTRNLLCWPAWSDSLGPDAVEPDVTFRPAVLRGGFPPISRLPLGGPGANTLRACSAEITNHPMSYQEYPLSQGRKPPTWTAEKRPVWPCDPSFRSLMVSG